MTVPNVNTATFRNLLSVRRSFTAPALTEVEANILLNCIDSLRDTVKKEEISAGDAAVSYAFAKKAAYKKGKEEGYAQAVEEIQSAQASFDEEEGNKIELLEKELEFLKAAKADSCDAYQYGLDDGKALAWKDFAEEYQKGFTAGEAAVLKQAVEKYEDKLVTREAKDRVRHSKELYEARMTAYKRGAADAKCNSHSLEEEYHKGYNNGHRCGHDKGYKKGQDNALRSQHELLDDMFERGCRQGRNDVKTEMLKASTTQYTKGLSDGIHLS